MTDQTPTPVTMVAVEGRRPSLLGRLVTLLFLALAVGLGFLVLIPIALLGLVLVAGFVTYLFLHRLVSRPRPPGGEGRENVRVVVRDSGTP